MSRPDPWNSTLQAQFRTVVRQLPRWKEGDGRTADEGEVRAMKTSFTQTTQRIACALLAGGALLAATTAQAQVESLNPNPTLPAGVGGAGQLEEFRHGTMRGAPMGRGVGGVNGADKNPADIMLRELGGTHSGRHTGHAAIRGGPVRAALRIEGFRGMPSPGDGAVYFARRGAYEDAIYAPQRGTYRQRAPRRLPSVPTGNQR
jgi:hypothetical protein